MDVEETRKLPGLVTYSHCIKKTVHLKQLRHTDVDSLSLIHFSCACIRSVLEYACQSFHHLPAYLSDRMEQIVENYPQHTYRGALVLSGLTTFFVRQEHFCNNLFNQIVGSEWQHNLFSLLSPFNTSSNYSTRFKKVFHVLWLPSKVVLGVRRSLVVIHKKTRNTLILRSSLYLQIIFNSSVHLFFR